MNHSDTSFLQNLFHNAKDHSSLLAGVCSLILAAVIAFGQTQRNGGVNDTKQVELERRIILLESDRATRAEVKAVNDSLAEFKTDTRTHLDKIENESRGHFDKLETLLLKELQFHRTHAY